MDKILKARIVEKFGTQFEFSKAIGEHEAVVSKVIRKRLILNTEQKKAWAEVLNCKPSEIFKEGA